MLDWPLEAAARSASNPRWYQAGSNICLDFHGDPTRAKLVVFSDGNHHMALEETLQTFVRRHTDLDDVFYATTPPGVLMDALQYGGLWLGNLRLSVRPQVFIGPDDVLQRAVEQQWVTSVVPFMKSRGNVLLVRRGNPLGIVAVDDLLRPEVRLFISNPDTEGTSFNVYAQTIRNIAAHQHLDKAAVDTLLSRSAPNTVFGARIHHREAPAALAEGRADVACVYHHLALRYVRIFPHLFEYVPLPGAPDAQPAAGNVVTRYSAGLITGTDQWGPRLLDFLQSPATFDIYARHGLAR